MALSVHTFADRPDLAARSVPADDLWPRYHLNADVLGTAWAELADELPQFQLLLHDDTTDTVLGQARSGPLPWDGTHAHLPDGIDAAIRQVLRGCRDGAEPGALCAFAVEVSPAARGRGLAEQSLRALVELAAGHGLGHLVVPVRPSWKERYPLVPIEEYATWRRDDGCLFDPWLRVHERLGGLLSTPLPRSMLVTGSVAEWESWVGLDLPRTGEYVFPHGLALLDVDREVDLGTYWGPGVWVVHPAPSGAHGSAGGQRP